MKNILADLRLLTILSLISLLIFSLDIKGLLNLPKNIIQTITVPIEYGVYRTSLSLGKQFEFVFAARKAAQENKALKEQLGDLLSENAALNKRLRETSALLNQNQTLSPDTFDLKAAKIIGVGRYLTIDKGESDGVKVGEIVIYKDNYIGTIRATSVKSSQILLQNDPESKLAVFSQGSGRKARGILEGQFGSDSLMDKILHQEEIAVGDLVYSEGLEGSLPKGLVVGKVTEVIDPDNQVFKSAKVTPIFDIKDLDLVFIMEGR